MADITVTNFGGIVNNIDPRDVEKQNFSDGQNFYVDGGSLTKRNGQKKLNAIALNGAILGIAVLYNPAVPYRTNASIPVQGDLVIASGKYIYTGKW